MSLQGAIGKVFAVLQVFLRSAVGMSAHVLYLFFLRCEGIIMALVLYGRSSKWQGWI
jgi:hypothetical protein